MDDRCRACAMMGGEESPCENDRVLAKIQALAKERGDVQNCPRVELHPHNERAADLISMVTDHELGLLAGEYFRHLTTDMEPHEALALARRVGDALHDRQANEIRFPKAPPQPTELTLSRRRKGR